MQYNRLTYMSMYGEDAGRTSDAKSNQLNPMFLKADSE